MRRSAAIFCLILLTGCQPGLQELKGLEPEANDFPGSLASEYLAYAESEAEQGRKDVANYFAAKGLNAYNGETVLPDTVSASLPDAVQKRLSVARETLMIVLTEDMKRVAPQKLARAQLLFDCWQQQHKQAGEEEASCADEFQSALSEVQTVAETFVQGDETVHVIKFSQKSAMLDEQSVRMIEEIAGRASGMARYEIMLEASSDQAAALAEERIAAVRGVFTDEGIPAERIKTEKKDTNAVHLSSDDKGQNRNSVKITARSFGQSGGQ